MTHFTIDRIMTDKAAEHALLLFLIFCGLLVLRIFAVREFRARYVAVFRIEEEGFAREIAALTLFTILTMVVMPAIDLTTTWLDFADFDFRPWLAWSGLGVLLLSVGVLWRAQYDWLKFFDLRTARQSSFIDTGIYRFIRHPFYVALLLLAVAQTLMLQNWIGGPAAIITFAIVYFVRIPVDEQCAMEFYGSSYLDYMERTNSLLPKLFEPRGK